ncbi:MAG: ABC transporter substrate-binding protein [Firmicutes bacterium]|nr:ABC transporter substrate-binding protein [Bacillota bacterium]
MRCKHWMAILLSCALVAGALAGCGGTAKAMGRYAEEPIALPENAGSVLYCAMKDGALIYYAQTDDGAVLRYVHGTAGVRVPWLEGLAATSVSEAPNGTVYAIVSGEEGTKLYCSKDGKAAGTIDTPDWSDMGGMFIQQGAAGGRATTGGGPITAANPQGAAPAPGGNAPQGPGGNAQGGPQGGGPQQGVRMDNMMIPRGVVALDDGFLISYMRGEVVQYDAAGKKVRSLTSGGEMGMGGMGRIGGNSGASMAVFENTLALADTGKREINLFDLATGEKLDTTAFDALDGSTYVGLDKDGLLLGDAGGVYRREGDAWKTVVDGELTSLVMPTLSLEGLFGDGAGAYYAFLSGDALTGGEGTQLLRFRFDESLPAEPDTTLTVFSLNDSSTVRLAIGQFQKKNPSVRVKLQVGMEEGGDAATADDVVRALNTSLLAGKGPDLLILDGLPIRSYIEKGVLKDITALAKKQTGLMQNLTNAYAKDGKIYGLPALFGFPAMVGDKAALAKFTSLETLMQTVENWPAQSAATTPILRAPDSLYDENTGMLMDYYEACVSSFTNANGSLDEAALAAYLTDALALSDALKKATPQATDGRRMGMFITNGRQAVQMDPRAVMEVAQGNALSCVQQITGMGPLMMIFSNLGDNSDMALQSLFGQGQFTPRCGVGVVSAGKQQELAEQFAAMLLSSEVQDSNLFDGLPVNRASLQSTLDSLKEMYFERSGVALDDMGFLALCDSLTTPLFTDETVKAAVAARMKSLLDGSMTPEEAAAKIVADTKLYLDEK